MTLLASISLALVGALTASAPALGVASQQNVHYGPGPREIMDVYSPAGFGGSPAVVFVHSLGRTEGEWDQAANKAAEAGYVGIAIDYDLQPWPTAFDDVEAAVQFVRAHAWQMGIDPSRVALGGSSLGGALALDVADRREQGFVQAAFGWSGGYDMAALALTSPGWHQKIATYLTGCPLQTCPDRYTYASAARYVDRNDPPARIVGSANELIPLAQLTRMDDALRAARVYHETRIVPGSAHGIGLSGTEWPLTLAFLQRQLGP